MESIEKKNKKSKEKNDQKNDYMHFRLKNHSAKKHSAKKYLFSAKRSFV